MFGNIHGGGGGGSAYVHVFVLCDRLSVCLDDDELEKAGGAT